MPSVPESNKSEEEKFRAESDLRTLVEAQEIKKDAKRMKAAMAVAEEKMAAMETVQKSA